MKKLLVRLAVLAGALGVAAGAYYLVQRIPQQQQDDVALVEVKRGDLTVRSYLRGELRAVRSLTLTAPNLGSQSQVLQLAPPGSLAQRGDLIIELDDSERVAQLEDSELSVEKIRQELKQAEVELEIRKTQDEVEIVKADFQVRRFELEVRRNELISAIDARKNELSLEEAKARKAKLEEDIKNRLAQREAELAVLREQMNKALLDVQREKRRIEQARTLAPISGLVSILENRSGGRGGFGTTTPTIREGDQIPAGISVAQLLDLSEMELVAKVEEFERANLREGQQAVVRLDALPGKEVSGTIKRLGTTASMNVFRGEATKKFDVILGIDMRQLLEGVGAKPAQVERILATARTNAAQGFGARARAPGGEGGGGAGGPGAMATRGPGGGQAGGAQAGGQRQRQAGGGQRQAQAGGGAPAGGQQRPGQAGGVPGAAAGAAQGAGGAAAGGDGQQRRPQVSPEMQERLRALTGGREMSELSQEERRQIFQQMRAVAGGGEGGGPGGGMPGGAPGGAAPADFTADQRRNAQLPRPPEQGSDVDILLRPGLLANAEIVVDSMKDVLYVPFQAIFDTPQGPIAYLWNGAALERRQVELGRRSESQVVIVAGLEEGDRISLEPPAGERREKKQQGGKKSGASQPPMPGGGGPGPGGPGGGRGGF